jgi:drug/metabolite transporter (DMT)-like permease
MTKAFHAENVATVSILNYIGILYAVLYGWIFFNEISGPLAFVGMLLVVGGVLFNILLVKRPSKN